MITFRIIQGAGAALMFPAALAIVLDAFPVRERGRALAIFFAVAGGLTSIGPIAGGYLTEWTWRAIFWVNIPVAIIALILTAKAKPDNTKHPAPLDYRGTVLISGGMGLAVLGLQQSSVWGWGGAATWLCIAAGLALIGAFVALRAARRQPAAADPDLREPRLRGRQHRPLPADDPVRAAVLLRQHVRADLARRKRLGNRALPADLLRRLRRRLAVGRQDPRPESGRGHRWCWAARSPRSASPSGASTLPDLSVSSQWYYIVLAGAGVGLVLSPANTDALNRVPRQPLRRGDRDHPDGAELRLQPRPRRARLGPDPREQVQPGGDPGRQGSAEGAGRRSRRLRQPGRRSDLRKHRPQRRQPSVEALRHGAPRLRRSPRGPSSTGWPR